MGWWYYPYRYGSKVVARLNLIIHSDTATTFKNNGIGVLADAITAKVVREINGQYELMLKYPDAGIYAQFITDRHVVMAKPDPVTDPQPFRIYRVNPVSNGTITAYARHVAYDTMGIPCAPFTAASCADAMASIVPNAVADCPFVFTTDKTTGGDLSVTVPKSIWGILGGTEGSILDRYGGEYDFDGFNIALYTRLGADRGVSIRYGKNLTTLEQDRNCADVYTGVFPYWKPYEGAVVMLPEQIINAAGTYNFTRIFPLDLSEKFEAAPTEEQLREAATNYMANNNIGVPDISWTVQFVMLEQSEEYKGKALLERVLLGDTVSVIFPRMNVNASARAVKIDFDPILERYNSITLGKVKSNLAATIAKQQQELERKPNYDALTRAADIAAKAIMGANGGAVRVLDTNADGKLDTLYIADNEDPDKALKVWRWNYEGWAASSTGYNGPFQMSATFEEGLLADFITAAHLTAGTIQSRDGSLFIDLDNGIIRVQSVDELATTTQRLDAAMSDLNADVLGKLNDISKYLSITTDGLTIGEVNNPYKIIIDNDELVIMAYGAVVQRFDSEGRSLIPELTVTRKFTLFGYLIEEDENQNVNCRYVGGE